MVKASQFVLVLFGERQGSLGWQIGRDKSGAGFANTEVGVKERMLSLGYAWGSEAGRLAIGHLNARFLPRRKERKCV
jgi:hypothetical protein